MMLTKIIDMTVPKGPRYTYKEARSFFATFRESLNTDGKALLLIDELIRHKRAGYDLTTLKKYIGRYLDDEKKRNYFVERMGVLVKAVRYALGENRHNGIRTDKLNQVITKVRMAALIKHILSFAENSAERAYLSAAGRELAEVCLAVGAYDSSMKAAREHNLSAIKQLGETEPELLPEERREKERVFAWDLIEKLSKKMPFKERLRLLRQVSVNGDSLAALKVHVEGCFKQPVSPDIHIFLNANGKFILSLKQCIVDRMIPSSVGKRTRTALFWEMISLPEEEQELLRDIVRDMEQILETTRTFYNTRSVTKHGRPS